MRSVTINAWDVAAGATVAVVVAAAALAWALGSAISPPSYPEFVVGALAWGAMTKSQDMAVLPTLIVALVASLWLFASAADRVRRSQSPAETYDALLQQVFFWSLPAMIAIAAALAGDRVDGFLLLTAFAGVIAFLLTSGRRAESPEELRSRSLALFASSLLSLAPLEAIMVAGRLLELPDERVRIATMISRGALPALIGIGAVAVWLRPLETRRLLPWLLGLAQVGLLGLYSALWPARLIGPEGTQAREPLIGLALVILAIMLWGAIDIARRLRAHRTSVATTLVSPIALFGLFVALRCANAVAPSLWTDDYHAGEALVGWWSLFDLGRLPYRDYIPARGFVADDLPGIVARLFFDGTAAALPAARQVTLALAALAALLSLHWRTGSLALAFVCTLLFGTLAYNNAWLLLVPFCCLMIADRWTWTTAAVWAGCALVLVVPIATQGLALALATAPAAMLFAWTERQRLASEGVRVLAPVAIVALVIAITPLRDVWIGSLRYVLENGSINQVAWGVPWSLSWPGEGRWSGFVFEVTRMSWLVVPLAATAIAAASFRDPSRWTSLVRVPLAVLLFSILLAPYAMGRIDPMAPSRAGLLSNFAWAALIPLLLYPKLDEKARALLLLVIASACTAIGLAPVSRNALDAAAFAAIRVPATVEGAAAGLPNVGRAIVDASYWERLLRLKRTLDELLQPGERYLDLTNRAAQHFYLGRPPAMAVAAPYNLVPIGEQRRAVDALKADPPRIALIEADNVTHDGGGLALRTPLLYRFVMATYTPETRNGFIVGRLRSRADELRVEDLDLWDRAFGNPDLRSIPIAWGRSWRSLEGRLENRKSLPPAVRRNEDLTASGDALVVSGAHPRIWIDLSSLNIAGRDVGLLGLEVTCRGKRGEMRMRVSWWGDRDPGPPGGASTSFAADDGLAIVPLDGFPRWLALERVRGIRLDFERPRACAAVALRDTWLAQRSSVNGH